MQRFHKSSGGEAKQKNMSAEFIEENHRIIKVGKDL